MLPNKHMVNILLASGLAVLAQVGIAFLAIIYGTEDWISFFTGLVALWWMIAIHHDVKELIS